MSKTKIEWTKRTWNPIRGCSRISDGCRHCYAESIAARFSGEDQPFHLFADRSRSGSKWTGKVELIEHKLFEPMSWREPSLIFVNSMSDLFHEALSHTDIASVFGVMVAAQHHTFQVLTKRAHRMADWFSRRRDVGAMPLPLENVWCGVSVENQDAHDERVPYLQSVPARVRFLSCEPLLGPIRLDLNGIHWVIVGGESGPGARPMKPDWVRAIRDQCLDVGVPFFFKQWGAWAPQECPSCSNPDWDHPLACTCGDEVMRRVGKKAAGRVLDADVHSEFPE